jgi:ATP-dependent Lon protease
MQVFLWPVYQDLIHPGAIKALQVFDAQTIEMLRQAQRTGMFVAMAFCEQNQRPEHRKIGESVTEVSQVCGYGRVEIIDELSTSAVLVNIYGLGKVRLGVIVDNTSSHWVVQVEIIPEQLELRGDMGIAYLNLQRRLIQWVGENVKEEQAQNYFIRSLKGPQEVVAAAATYLIHDSDLQQMILELDDVNEKIETISRIGPSSRRNELELSE